MIAIVAGSVYDWAELRQNDGSSTLVPPNSSVLLHSVKKIKAFGVRVDPCTAVLENKIPHQIEVDCPQNVGAVLKGLRLCIKVIPGIHYNISTICI